MRFKLSVVRVSPSPVAVSGACWTPSNELITVSDDRTIRKCAHTGAEINKVAETDYFATATAILGTATAAAGEPCMAIGCSDGSLRLVSPVSGRVERTVANAHTGSITSVCWSSDGSTLVSTGEDGCLKLWSRAGNLRSKLVERTEPITSAQWAQDGTSILYACGDCVHLQPLSSALSAVKWRSHAGAVLCVDWQPVHRVIVTGGEDGCYRLWDEFGVLLFSSRPLERAVTSVRFNANGSCFAVGSYDLLLLCDRAGWAHSRHRTSTGTVGKLEWTSDGTALAAAGAAGIALIATLVERTVESGSLTSTLTESNSVLVRDLSGGVENSRVEELEFSAPVVDLSLAYGQLIVVTPDQLHIYSAPHFTAPHTIPMRSTPRFLLQASTLFAIGDAARGLSVYSYDGKLVSTPRLPAGLSPATLHAGNTSISNDCVAIAVGAVIHVLDIDSSKPVCEPIAHNTDILTVALSAKHLLFIDRQRDCFCADLHASPPVKLSSQTHCVRWHAEQPMAVAVAEGQVRCFVAPSLHFIDMDLAALSVLTLSPALVGHHAELVSFESDRVTVRKSDGTLNQFALNPFPRLIHACVARGEWSAALAACRWLHDAPHCWAMLAALAIQAAQLDIAEQALAALELVTKLRTIQHIKAQPSSISRQAALLAYQRQFGAAESLLLSHGLHYRAIQLALDRCRWIRAIKLAIQYQTHVDTVLRARRRWLQHAGKDEFDPTFLQMQDTHVSDAEIDANIARELERESSRNEAFKSALPTAGIVTSPTHTGIRAVVSAGGMDDANITL